MVAARCDTVKNVRERKMTREKGKGAKGNQRLNG